MASFLAAIVGFARWPWRANAGAFAFLAPICLVSRRSNQQQQWPTVPLCRCSQIRAIGQGGRTRRFHSISRRWPILGWPHAPFAPLHWSPSRHRSAMEPPGRAGANSAMAGCGIAESPHKGAAQAIWRIPAAGGVMEHFAVGGPQRHVIPARGGRRCVIPGRGLPAPGPAAIAWAGFLCVRFCRLRCGHLMRGPHLGSDLGHVVIVQLGLLAGGLHHGGGIFALLLGAFEDEMNGAVA